MSVVEALACNEGRCDPQERVDLCPAWDWCSIGLTIFGSVGEDLMPGKSGATSYLACWHWSLYSLLCTDAYVMRASQTYPTKVRSVASLEESHC